jgi:hypothetical protein
MAYWLTDGRIDHLAMRRTADIYKLQQKRQESARRRYQWITGRNVLTNEGVAINMSSFNTIFRADTRYRNRRVSLTFLRLLGR